MLDLNGYRATVHREVAQLRRVITDQSPQVYEKDSLVRWVGIRFLREEEQSRAQKFPYGPEE